MADGIHVEHRHHVGMGELGHRPGLEDQRPRGVAGHDLRAQYFEGHLSLQLGVVRAQDSSHRAASHLLDGDVPAEAIRGDQGGHGRQLAFDHHRSFGPHPSIMRSLAATTPAWRTYGLL
jgi:hypothetical protein